MPTRYGVDTGPLPRFAPAGAMPTGERLRTTPEIRAVFDARRSVGGPFLVVHGRSQSPPGHGRVAVIAGRRVGGAVARNRAKRRLRAAVAESGILPGYDMVLTARDRILNAPYADIVRDVRRQMEQAAGRVRRT